MGRIFSLMTLFTLSPVYIYGQYARAHAFEQVEQLFSGAAKSNFSIMPLLSGRGNANQKQVKGKQAQEVIEIKGEEKREMSVLIVMSGVDYVTGKDGKRHKTGYWAEEFVVPYREFQKTGIKVVVATPGGAIPTPDPASFDPAYWPSEKELQEAQRLIGTAPELKSPLRLESLQGKDLSVFDAVFYPGGHAPMEDLAKNTDSGRLLRYFHSKDKPTALLCHGPVALLGARLNGDWPYRGYKLTVFSNSEEKQTHLASVLTYSAEDELKKLGSIYQSGKDWQPNVVEDRELITGQNPMSSLVLAKALIERLKKSSN